MLTLNLKNKMTVPNRTRVSWELVLWFGWMSVVSVPAPTQSAATPAKPESQAPPCAVAPPQSVFIDDPQFGKDPFFPSSTRRVTKVVARTNTAVDFQNIQLTVKHILVGQTKKLVLINNRTFEPGEEAEVIASGQKIKLRCLEIREKSVLVKLDQGEAVILTTRPMSQPLCQRTCGLS